MSYTLYHYYEQDIGPFRNLSSLPTEEADQIMNRIRLAGNQFASRRSPDYMSIRRDVERMARSLFTDKGGQPRSLFPYYFTLEACQWLESWYTIPCKLSISLDELPDDRISFTYGDLFPTMRYEDGKPYRKQVYTKSEIAALVDQYGLPQIWNSNGDHGPERYIEFQLWDDEIIDQFVNRIHAERRSRT
ncbi:hypothetical protein [Paenibacillus sp. OV219]|uniref:hypothetical protein n=1 Tax=Paenibacillus sp. OV219 TaxID=1884377 RepID=UPI0008AFE0EF|nr:hypothetical protein [Paenibacillus sp. OV219]SEO93743.1 hypothetical protein SAMN05518847_11328 [Paenibacillus sp. OV219]